MTELTRRQHLVGAMVEEWSRIRGRAYRVRRGPVNWVAWDWTKWRRGVSIEFHGEQLLHKDGWRVGPVTFQVFARLGAGDVPLEGELPELNDGLLEEMHQDSEGVLTALSKRTLPDGDTALLKLGLADAEIVDAWDLELRVQGKLVFFDVTY